MTEEILCIWNTINLDMHSIFLRKELEKNIQSLTNIMIILGHWETTLAMFQLQIAKCA